MATEDDVRQIALSLPEANEQLAWGMPTFRIRKRIFASLSREEGAVGFYIDKEERAELIAAEPQIYFLKVGHDDRYNFARARLDRIEVDELTEILTEAWRRLAPVRLRRELEDGSE